MKRTHPIPLACLGYIGVAVPLIARSTTFSAAAVLCLASTLAFAQVAAVETKTMPKTPDPCTSTHQFATTDCALTWHGITLYGAYDVGIGWVSHGLPENGSNIGSSSHPTTCRRRGWAFGARKSSYPAGPLCSTPPQASIRSPACSPMRQPPTSSTTAFPGPAIP